MVVVVVVVVLVVAATDRPTGLQSNAIGEEATSVPKKIRAKHHAKNFVPAPFTMF